MDNILDIIDEMNERVNDMTREMDSACGYDELGLDPRAGRVWISPDCIITCNRRVLDYYGGFEYVDSEHVYTIGDYTIYMSDADRVQEAISCFYERKKESETG